MEFSTTLDESKDLKLMTYENSIKNSIKNLLSKTDSKKPFREHMSINYDEIYQVGITDVTMKILQNRVTDILAYERRISVTDVTTTYYKAHKTLVVTIKYFINNTTKNDTTAVSISF
jgi:phage baseplate assembly protein W